MNDVIIIGAGIAGASVAHQCAKLGLKVLVVEQENYVAPKASGNPAGILYPYMASNYDAMTAFYLQGLAHTSSLLHGLGGAHLYDICGMLHLPKKSNNLGSNALISNSLGSNNLQQLQSLSAKLGLPPEIMQSHEQGFFMASSGWVNVPAFCAALLNISDINIRFNIAITSMQHINGKWCVVSSSGEQFSATNLVIASAYEAQKLLPNHMLPMNIIRGQITYLPAELVQYSVPHVICYGGYITPEIDGIHYVGATFEKNRHDLEVEAAGHEYNINLLQQAVAPPLRESGQNEVLHSKTEIRPWGVTRLKGRAAFRTVSGDRFPIIGAVYDDIWLQKMLDATKYSKLSAQSLEVPHLPNLYVSLAHGARGTTSAPLAGAFIASQIARQITNAPCKILNDEMVKLLATPRFALRNWRRN